MNMKLIIGLGNPGKKYAKTRHNIGFQWLSLLAEKYNIQLKYEKCQAQLGEGLIHGVRAILGMPLTFMNLSGLSVLGLQKKYGIHSSDMLIIYDDVDLDLGQLRLRLEGSHGGHKGMKSIIENLGTDKIPRLRCGIGRPEVGELSDFVLASFTPEENRVLADASKKFLKGIDLYLQGDCPAALLELNKKKQT